MLLTSSSVMGLLSILLITIFLLKKYLTRNHDYWRKRGVFCPKPIPFFGNALEMCRFKRTIGEWLKVFYDSCKDPFLGIFIFDEPCLIIKSPELVKNILIKDFSYFTDRALAAPKHNISVANMLFFQKSPAWKMDRSKLTPLFTGVKIKGMLQIINKVGENMTNYIEANLGVIEIKALSVKFTTNVVTRCFFGINAFCFDSEEHDDFTEMGKNVFDVTWRNGLVQGIYFFRHDWVDLLHLDFVPQRTLDILANIFWNTMKLREESNTRVNDMIDLLNDITKTEKFRNDGERKKKMILAQAVQIFIAGYEGISTTVTFMLYELSMNPNIQNELRNEIVNNLKKHEGITYEGVSEMKYLEMCVNETLRKYPPLPFLDRRCNANYQIPGTNVTVEKGTAVYIPVYGLHMDEQYFPDPQSYNPERFREKKSDGDGFTFLPLGEGPRNCIGWRLGLLGVKMAMVHILSKFEIEKTENTPKTVKFEPRCFTLHSKLDFQVRFKNISTTA